ncbi:sugar ABC transporter substrate-binding protein [Undibacterium fentianense]|uniref:Sugar ABC transporter substrate-binding protein n=1 Tax=Undibacterium fentianense TaxID=2828728 RepID=A0A941IDR5_9BURK|nr:sugar ABC transporter substrate-binding protein [Undibacterium fentianense]MBR7800268.1 sugar ABC transporter substrate-binding protein [Undibacterium fentianense]
MPSTMKIINKTSFFKRIGQAYVHFFGAIIFFVCPLAIAAELNIWIMSTTAQPQQDMREILRPYLIKNPGLRVNVTVLNWESAWNRIVSAAALGQGPDLVELGSTWVAAISAKDALEPLSLEQQNEVGGARAFFPALWVTTHHHNQGQVFAIPWYAGARVAYYRTDLFEKAGIKASDAFANWSSFKQAMQKINGIKFDGKPVAALGYPGKSDSDILHNLAPWIWNAGGDFLSPDRRLATINSPESLQAIRYYTSFVEEGLVPLSALEKDSVQIESGFFTNQYTVIFSGPWVLKTLTTPKAKGGQLESAAGQNFGVASYPAGIKGNQTFFSGSDLALMKSSKNKEEAWKLLRYLVSRDAQLKFSKLSGMLPARIDALNDPILMQDPHYAEFVGQIKLGRHYPVVSAWGQLETIFRSHIASLVTAVDGKKSLQNSMAIRKNLDQATLRANAILSKE